MSVHVSIFVCLSAKKTSFKIKWLHISKNVSIKSCHILKRIKVTILCLDFFGSDLSKLDQTWSNLMKIDQIEFLTNQKMLQ